jgi:hypothetical protein
MELAVRAPYVVGVDGDIDELDQCGLQLDGAAAVPLEDMHGMGRVGYLRDPDGNAFGLILNHPVRRHRTMAG